MIAHLPPEEAGRRYRNCPDPKEKTRRHLSWLLLRPAGPACCARAAPPVGPPDAYAALRRWNGTGPNGLADHPDVVRGAVGFHWAVNL